MNTYQQIFDDCSFECVGTCNTSVLQVQEAVRDMCASGNCHKYGTNWACPPHCGSLDEFQSLLDERATCYVVQTVAQLEDEFDGEGMMEAVAVHQKRMQQLADALQEDEQALVLSAGTCAICSECTCPDAPCRFPERRLNSMEAAGLMVNDVCIAAEIPYNHGKNTIAYTGCLIV